MALFTIVNDKDEVIGAKKRSAMTCDDIYRVSALWLTNSKGEVLLARRAFTKSHDPGKWGPAVAGTVEDGETYELNIIKEMDEELGLRGVSVRAGEKQLRSSKKWRYFGQRFYATVDKRIDEFTIQADEVAEVRWFTREQLQKEVAEHPDHFLRSVVEYTKK